jgi:hypothetical protein
MTGTGAEPLRAGTGEWLVSGYGGRLSLPGWGRNQKFKLRHFRAPHPIDLPGLGRQSVAGPGEIDRFCR